jgi:hypothetical protein
MRDKNLLLQTHSYNMGRDIFLAIYSVPRIMIEINITGVSSCLVDRRNGLDHV